MNSINSQQRSPLLAAYAVLVFGFIYLPIVVLVLYSFNRDGVGGFPPRHFTLDWYRQLFSDSAIWDAIVNSLIVCVIGLHTSQYGHRRQWTPGCADDRQR